MRYLLILLLLLATPAYAEDSYQAACVLFGQAMSVRATAPDEAIKLASAALEDLDLDKTDQHQCMRININLYLALLYLEQGETDTAKAHIILAAMANHE